MRRRHGPQQARSLGGLFLAPDITEAILEARQPAHLTLADLIRAELPASWSAQRTLLGFSPRF